jgi:hypothetical protein
VRVVVGAALSLGGDGGAAGLDAGDDAAAWGSAGASDGVVGAEVLAKTLALHIAERRQSNPRRAVLSGWCLR